MIFQCILFHDWLEWTDTGVFQLFSPKGYRNIVKDAFVEKMRKCSRCGKVQIRKETF